MNTSFQFSLIDYDIFTDPFRDSSSDMPMFAFNISKNILKPETNKRKVHSSFILFFLEKGSAWFLLNDQTIQVDQPALVFVPPATPYGITYSEDGGTLINAISFSFRFLNQLDQCLPDQLHFQNRFLTVTNQNKRLLLLNETSIRKVKQAMAYWVPLEHVGCSTFRLSALTELLSLTCDLFEIEKNPPHPEKNIAIRVTEMVVENPGYPYSIPEMANQFYMSPEGFQKKFKKLTGMTVMNFVNSVRLGKAFFLLTHLPPKEVARQTGFTDFSYFCKVFKHYQNETPAHFQKRQIDLRKVRRKC